MIGVIGIVKPVRGNLFEPLTVPSTIDLLKEINTGVVCRYEYSTVEYLRPVNDPRKRRRERRV